MARADFHQDHHRVTETSLRPPSHWRRPCGRPRSTWLRGSILIYSPLTLGSTQPGEKPVTVHSGDASSTRLHSIKGHATEERERMLANNVDLYSGRACITISVTVLYGRPR